ncbi:MAG: ferritin family protein [Desulfobacterales bacterium]|nr:ferritin family protein [Desulfobacterales bacterium]
MFTKEDLRAYFDQLQRLEDQMYETYRNMHDQISHPKYKRVLAQLMRDEKDHSEMIEALKAHFAE